MNTVKNVAEELGIPYHNLWRYTKLGRIPGVSAPPPRGQWHLLTTEEVQIIRKYFEDRKRK